MDFKAIWKILKNHGWSASKAPASNLESSYLYYKPDVTARTAEPGISVFNSEVKLLIYLKGDKALCRKYKIDKVAINDRRDSPVSGKRRRTLSTTAITNAAADIPDSTNVPSKKRHQDNNAHAPVLKRRTRAAKAIAAQGKPPTVYVPSPINSESNGKGRKKPTPRTDKKSKKSTAAEEQARQRTLSSFSNIWGTRNASASDGVIPEQPESELPVLSPMTPALTPALTIDYATTPPTPAQPAPEPSFGMERSPVRWDHEPPENTSSTSLATHASTPDGVSIDADVQRDTSAVRSISFFPESVCAQEDEEMPMEVDEEDQAVGDSDYHDDDDANDDDDEDNEDNEGNGTFTQDVPDSRAQGIQDGPVDGMLGLNHLFFNEVEDVDPNLVPDDEQQGLESGEEDDNIFGYPSECSDSDNEAEYEDELEDEESNEIDDEGDVFRREAQRIAERLRSDEAEKLHMAVEGSSEVYTDEQLRELTLNGWDVMPDNTVSQVEAEGEVDDKYNGYCGPSADILRFGKSPLQLFYYFLPKSFWNHVAVESNRYWQQTFDARVELSLRRNHENPRVRNKTRLEIISKMEKFKRIYPHEIVQYIGLLIAHMLCPQKRMHMHWSTTQVGAVPAGTFGSVMSRNRFQEISKFLHFSDNTAPEAKTDRAWKIRPVLSTLERTFKQGYVLGYRIALDEGMLPTRNRHNPTRTYMKDKPHKWGSKCIMTCCAESGYCKRVELDVGVKHHRDDGKSSDTKSGPAGAIRNIACVFRGARYQGRRLVVTDRYYTSIPLVQQLRTMGFNFVGTIQKNRLGWCHGVEYPNKKRPKTTPRGIFKMARCRRAPGIIALGWMDNRPVYFLSSQVSTKMTTILRREKNGDVRIVPCPQLVVEYQKYMGGVDIHDQLRLQSYSLQLKTRFQKYYKSLAIGLVDMALVNAFITHNLVLKRKGKPKLEHLTFFKGLQEELVKTTLDDFACATGDSRIVVPPRSPRTLRAMDHILKQTTDKRPIKPDGVVRSRHRQCKVCHAFKGEKKKGGTTTMYCQTCSADKKGMIFLCNHSRNHPGFSGVTCHQIWHSVWSNGQFAPKKMRDRSIRMSNGAPPATAPATAPESYALV